MNKKKSLLLLILSCIMAFALAFAFGCSSCKDNTPDGDGDDVASGNPDDNLLQGKYEDEDDVEEPAADPWVLQDITLNVSNVKTDYNFGEDYDTNENSKIVVTAKYASVDSLLAYEATKHLTEGVAEIEYKTATVTDYTVNCGQYDKNAVGTYLIYVNYTYAKVTRSACFEVNVNGTEPAVGGITLKLVGAESDYSYAIESSGLSISEDTVKSLFELYTVGADLAVSEDPVTEGYTIEYYYGGTKLDNLENLSKMGTYTIFVKYNNSSAYFTIDVSNEIVSIELADLESIVTTQVQSPNEVMTATWQFVVTYKNGVQETVKKGDAGLIFPNILTVLPATGSVTVLYDDGYSSQSVNVNYTITKNDDLETEINTFNYSLITGMTDQGQLTEMTGTNSFITIVDGGSKVRWRSSSYIDFAADETAKDAMTVTYNGFGALEMAIRSDGKISSIAVVNSEGKYMTAVYPSGVGISEYKTENGYIYAADDTVNNTFRSITFLIPEAGTYSIRAFRNIETGSEVVACTTYTRFNKLVMTDIFDGSADRVSYEFTLDTYGVVDYVTTGEAPESVDLTGLTMTFTENHSDESIEDVVTHPAIADVSAVFSGCDWTKLGSTGSVTVTYTNESGTYSKSYTINILSPVAIEENDVNSVVAVMEDKELYLAENANELTISTEDIVLHANSANGATITSNNVTYELYAGETKQDSLTVGVGTYTLKVTVTLNNTKVDGTTHFTATISDIVVKEYVDESERTTTVTFTAAADGSGVKLEADKTDRVVKISTLGSLGTNTSSKFENEKYPYSVNVQTTATSTKTITVVVEGAVDETVNISVLFYHTTGSNAIRTLGIFEGAYSSDAKLLASEDADNSKLYEVAVEGKSDGTYSITCTDGTTLYVVAVIVEYLPDPEFASRDFVDYELTVNTDNVKKVYYVDEDTTFSAEGLDIKLSETHTLNTEDNKLNQTIALDDAKLKIEFKGDLTARGTTGTVTVTYTVDEENVLKQTFTVEIASTVTGVNDIYADKTDKTYTFASADAENVEIVTTDITVNKNSADGDAIATDNIVYELYSGETKLDSWTVTEAGTYTLKVIVTLANTAGANTESGTTVFTKEITIKVNAYVDPSEAPTTQTITYTVDTSVDMSSVISSLKSEDDDDNVATFNWVSGSTSEQSSSNKATVGETTYTGNLNVNGGGRYITLEVTKNIKSITIVCGSGNAGRSIGLYAGTVKSASNSTTEAALGYVTIPTAGGTDTFTVSDLESGTYTITAVGNGSTATVRIFAVIIEYEV